MWKPRLLVALGALAIGGLVLSACAGEEATLAPTPDVGPSSAPVPSGFEGAEVLVDTAWLAGNLDAANVRVLDVRSSEDYQAGHITGAVNVTTARFTETVNDIRNMVSSPEEFAESMGQAGVGPDTHVVIVDAGNMLWASRLLWTLDYYGHEKSSVLHGGMAAWEADARDVTRKAPAVTETSFTATANPDLVADLSQLLGRLDDDSFVVLDNRSPGEYTGEDVRTERGGHIPGAVNINWTNHLSDGDVPSFRSPAELKSLYEGAGITRDREVASYCQTAIRATHGYLALRLLGYENLKIYDASWEEWGNKPDTPIEG